MDGDVYLSGHRLQTVSYDVQLALELGILLANVPQMLRAGRDVA
jgi:hypothetical protein